MTGITNSQSKIQMPKNPSTRYRNFKICMYQKKKKETSKYEAFQKKYYRRGKYSIHEDQYKDMLP